jgi:valyl-tRNA synthetase
VVGFDGKLTEATGPYAGMRVKAARAKVVEDLKKKGLIDHIDEKYIHSVGTCYKCGTIIEPLPLPQWYIKIAPLAKKAIFYIKNKKIVFAPKRFEKIAIQWLSNFHDWNISRQIVWGIRIPAWQCDKCNHWIVTDGQKPDYCPKCKNNYLNQDADVFDTWFSSGQWPYATLLAQSEIPNSNGQTPQTDFNYFYPTSVMETGYDILPWWVCRMIMLGIYATGKIPFHTVCLHGLVRDAKGQKMSKSKGNVINPIVMTDLYGADSLRMALVFGTAFGNDVPMSENKIRGMRNFGNKLWNIGRFIKMNVDNFKKNKKTIPDPETKPSLDKLRPEDKKILSQLGMLQRRVKRALEEYHFDQAANALYEFTWHSFADKYIEATKEGLRNNDTAALHALLYVYLTSLKLLHPFMPFITEEIYAQLSFKKTLPLIISPWPKE